MFPGVAQPPAPNPYFLMVRFNAPTSSAAILERAQDGMFTNDEYALM